MIYHVAHLLKSYWSVFNVVHYISFRALMGLLTALLSTIFFGSLFLRLSARFFRAPAREYTPEGHKAKGVIPTMGGLFILVAILVSLFLWCDLTDRMIWLFAAAICSFGTIGAADDWSKIRYKKGIRAKTKFRLQLFFAVFIAFLYWYFVPGAATLGVPFLKWVHPSLGLFFIPWMVFILIGTSNAVNLTDGLDGLAIGSLIPNFATFAAFAYVAGHTALAEYLHILHAPSSELAVAGAIACGASLGFLWYNAHPAQVFMGDVGSLSLGAALAFLAIAAKQELLLPVAGALFVAETVSVVLQVGSFKLRGKRLFRMAPIHHHFELIGWPEAKITARCGIISLVMCLLALVTLKLR